jgi:phosphonoacetate hydrolase
MFLITVFDGLRPDFVRPELTPTLWRLRQEGVWFAESHCVFPSSTRVNAPALATGSYPSEHMIPGNRIYVREVEPSAELNTGRHEDLRRLRLGASGRMLGVPTLAEVLAAHGRRTVVVGTGSPGCTYLLHPEIAGSDRLYHASFCEPSALAAEVEAKLGPSPLAQSGIDPDELVLRLVEHGARALTEVLVPNVRPELACFWCTVPDGYQHRLGLGAPGALAALREADRGFGEMLGRLRAQLAEPLDLFVTSDHGYATVSGHLNAGEALRTAGLVERPWFEDTVVAADGDSVLIYLPGDDGRRRCEIAAYLLAQPWIAAVFTRDGNVPGTLSLADVRNQSPRSPDIVCALAWDDGVNEHGAAGRALGGGYIAVGAGDHGGISPYEMHNTLIAAGPSFKSGWESPAACGIPDIAPTVLTCLGLPPPAEWTGRTLSEALDSGPDAPETARRTVAVESEAARQHLWLAEVGASVYVCGARKSLR